MTGKIITAHYKHLSLFTAQLLAQLWSVVMCVHSCLQLGVITDISDAFIFGLIQYKVIDNISSMLVCLQPV